MPSENRCDAGANGTLVGDKTVSRGTAVKVQRNLRNPAALKLAH
jgi:hypothetical protein